MQEHLKAIGGIRMTETLLDMFKNLSEEEKEEFIKLIIEEINKEIKKMN